MRSRKRDGERVVGLLPGSRTHEVQNNFPTMIEVMRRIHLAHQGIRFHVACFKQSQRNLCQQMLHEAATRDPTMEEIAVDLAVGRTPEIIAAAECCLMVSGSVSLELLARRTPAVVQYRGSWSLTVLRRLFMTCPFVTLPNLMADREIMPEFVFRGDPRPPAQRMADILGGWLRSEADRQRAVEELDELANRVARPGGTARTAEFILKTLGAGVTRKVA